MKLKQGKVRIDFIERGIGSHGITVYQSTLDKAEQRLKKLFARFNDKKKAPRTTVYIKTQEKSKSFTVYGIGSKLCIQRLKAALTKA